MDDELDARARQLPRDIAPPDDLERRTTAALRARGLIGGGRRPAAPHWLARMAAGALLFAAGAAANGYWQVVGPDAPRPAQDLPAGSAATADPCGGPRAATAGDDTPCTVIWF